MDYSPNSASGVLFSLSWLKLGLVTLIVSGVGAASGETFQGRVVGVSDGDTITVLDSSNKQHKVRLSGIDAPEKSQAYGQRSKQSLSVLVFGKPVDVETTKRDRYGREIGKVLTAGLDVNLEQVRLGLAWHYKAYEREQPPQDRETYNAAEQVARKAREGLWQDPAPVPPWEYRHGAK